MAELLPARQSSPAAAAVSIHNAFAAECGTYFVWQTLGLVYSFKRSGQPGPLTRLISCTDEEWAQHPIKQAVRTHRAPSFSVNPRNGDAYAAYNKPAAVIDWLQHDEIPEEYVFIFDTDMLLRRPFLPSELHVRPGQAASAAYWYMDGVANGLALRHIPEVSPQQDELAGPIGRRGDQVSGWFVMTTADVRRVAEPWLRFSEDVRLDPEAWRLTNDLLVEPGGRPWIAEMYGFSFGAASVGVSFHWNRTAMIYPRDYPEENPRLLHYGLDVEIRDEDGKPLYRWDKAIHRDFDALACPPWDLSEWPARRGLFAHPPLASSIGGRPNERFKDLLIIENMVTLNSAFCRRHIVHCPPSEQLTTECSKVAAQAAALDHELSAFAAPDALCKDFDPRCQAWAAHGQCKTNEGFMKYECRASCKYCDPVTGHVLTVRGQYY